MTTPPQKLSFAQEMELLKKQKAHEAEQAKALVAQKRLELAQKQAVQTVHPVPNAFVLDEARSNNADTANTRNIQSQLDLALSAVMPAGNISKMSPSRAAGQTSTTPVLQEDERQLKIKAMEAAFAKHVGAHEPKKGKKEKTKGIMLFCTICRSTTPGEHVTPGNAGIGLALGLIGLVPGIAYFLYQKVGGKQHCTHCQATTLVAMNSVQARTLCGDQHAALMAAGWPEMRRAERDHTRKRRIAMGKILVVGVVLLGASLYVLRAPSSPLKGAMAHEANQRAQTMDMIEKQYRGEEPE